MPLIPPLLIDDKFVTDIQTKANILHKFFAEQCTLLRNGSVLPVCKPNVFNSSKTKIFSFQRSRNSQNNKSIKHK